MEKITMSCLAEMLNALQAKRKLGFLNGTLKKPRDSSPDLKNWLSVNSMVIGWIRSSIEPKVRSTVTYISDAHQLWDNLKERFSVGNEVRVHQIKAQLASCRQDRQPVLDYFKKSQEHTLQISCLDRFSRTLIGTDEERDGIYYFKDIVAAKSHRVVGSQDQALWHQRLGHLSFSVLSDLSFVSHSSMLATSSFCDICFRAEQTREVFPDSL
ncbi:uncharacterized protein LOC112084648 [Eutrema salsugineum]|uniref:uncharacterized protein LOC112084648 n=1 Tax=Eutrema salsugineum TaxID=72664 RepID=UPI000CED11A8|nr:uncharacterized protein LOC112084648 [Eutrema salsugineum]